MAQGQVKVNKGMQKKWESHTAHSQAAGRAYNTYQRKKWKLTNMTEEVIEPKTGEM
jgi:hypothetical protein